LAVDEGDEVLVWTGREEPTPAPARDQGVCVWNCEVTRLT